MTIKASAKNHGPFARVASTMGLLVVVLAVAGCSATRAPRQAPTTEGFLGDYSQLREGKGDEASLFYLNESADFSQYHAIIIDSFTMWLSSRNQSLNSEERQAISSYCYGAFERELGKSLNLTKEPGPGVLRLRVALTEAKGANVPASIVTGVIPQARVLTMLGGMAADKAVFVGKAAGEAELLDSVTNRRLMAGVDERWGTKMPSGMFSTWGDVQSACDLWAERSSNRLVRLGVRTKPAAAE